LPRVPYRFVTVEWLHWHGMHVPIEIRIIPMINDKSDRIAMFSCIEFGEGNNCGADDWGELVEYRRLYPRMCCEATDQKEIRDAASNYLIKVME
jgi:hypothetical protein